MRVCLFGTYDRVAHPRIAVLEAALREGGAEVVEAHVPAWPGGTDEKLAAARHPFGPGRLVRRPGPGRAWPSATGRPGPTTWCWSATSATWTCSWPACWPGARGES